MTPLRSDGQPATDINVSRDPIALLHGAKAALESADRFFREYPDWRDRLAGHAAERIALHGNLQLAQQILARLRLVLVVLPPFDLEEDWAGVERAARDLDERPGGVVV